MFARLELTPTAALDDVRQRDLATEGRRSAKREAQAMTRLQSPAADTLAVDFRDTPSRRLDEPRPRTHRPELVVSCDVADRRDPAARPRASPNAFRARDVHRAVAAPTPREKAPPECFFSGHERPSGTPDRTRRRGDDEDRSRGWPASRAARTHVLASAPLGRSEPAVVTPAFPLHRCS
jgi:hypothetical protein